MQITTIDKAARSLCPVCLRHIDARIYRDGDSVMMAKSCPEHGEFSDIYWSDANLYIKFNGYWDEGSGLANPRSFGDCCPFDCGICSNHKTSTILANIDLTNRCNLSCPVCFANAEISGRLYEPSLEQVREMMTNLRDERPVPCPAIQFSGGEPTLRDDLPQIISMAKEMSFSQIQIATNGIRLAYSLNLCRALQKSGLHTVYLQFDGVSPDVYVSLRGRNILDLKLRAIENFRRSGLDSVVLVPTLQRGVNDSQVGDMVRFAARNLDVIKGLNVQPLSFTGRVDQTERLSKRITISDFLHLVEEQTEGEITMDDFYPVPLVAPISRLIQAETGVPRTLFSVHPHCGAATYVFCHRGHLVPINRFIDVEGFFELISQEVEQFDGSSVGRLKMRSKILKETPKLINESAAPEDLNLVRMLMRVLKNGTRDSLREIHMKSLFLGAMHFQDLYNADLDRLQRCGIHYATPDGRIIPFCTYNIIHRREVERRFSFPLKGFA